MKKTKWTGLLSLVLGILFSIILPGCDQVGIQPKTILTEEALSGYWNQDLYGQSFFAE